MSPATLQQAGGQAVALCDYTLDMQRVAPPKDAGAGVAACVTTPKGFIQCV
jgi:hypothetical protein